MISGKFSLKVMSFSFIMLSVGSLFAQPAVEKPENRKGYDKTKDVGAPAPKGVDVPFDGTKASIDSNWHMWPKQDMAITWKLMDNPQGDGKVLMANGGRRWGTHDLVTKKKYKDFEAHVEFVMMGRRGDDKPDGYSNSGVYLQNRYEIQIESPKRKKDKQDPYNWKIGPHGIGAFCMERVPDANAWRPNGQWHAYHIIFKAAKWDGDKMTEPARATVWWNGIKIHDNVQIKKANGGVKVSPSPEGLKLQEHGQDVRYTNIWIKDLSKS